MALEQQYVNKKQITFQVRLEDKMGNLATVPGNTFIEVNKNEDNLTGDYERHTHLHNFLDFALKLESSLYSPNEVLRSEKNDVEWVSDVSWGISRVDVYRIE